MMNTSGAASATSALIEPLVVPAPICSVPPLMVTGWAGVNVSVPENQRARADFLEARRVGERLRTVKVLAALAMSNRR